MRLRRRYLWLAGLLGFALTMLPSIASSEPLPVEAVNEGGIYGETHRWSNVPQTVIAGEKVTFSNPTEVPHGVEWRSTLKASCEEGAGKVPVGTTPAASGTKWSGKCTFSQAGTYTFYCTVHGAAMSGTITVTNGEPVATTEAATSVTEHEATLKGTVNPEGKATKYFFKYGTTTSYGKETSLQSAGEGTTNVSVSAPATSLAPATTYHFRLVATNEKGTAEGADQTFMTPSPPGAPTATTEAASLVGETEATLKGTVNPNGQVTTYFFNWGLTTSYEHQTSTLSAGQGSIGQAVSATLTGLAPGTVYHFQLVAHNVSGNASGTDRMFTTASPPPPPPPPSTTTTSTTTTPPPTTTIAEPPPGPPLVGGPSLRSSQRGSSVHGSLDVSQSGAGGRLEVDLLVSSASLARRGHRAKQVTVGRLVRNSVSAGKLSFSVALNARGKSALRHHHRLALTVKITLTPPMGKEVQITRSVVLRI
jgi:plastocyanin